MQLHTTTVPTPMGPFTLLVGDDGVCAAGFSGRPPTPAPWPPGCSPIWRARPGRSPTSPWPSPATPPSRPPGRLCGRCRPGRPSATRSSAAWPGWPTRPPTRRVWHPRAMAREMTGEGRQVRLGTIYAAHGASHGFVLVLPAVLVTLRAEFGASFTTLGTVATVSSMLYGLGALPAGLLADKVGAPVLLRVFAGASAVCCVLAALAPGIWWLAAALALLGAAGALYHPSGLAEVTLNVPGGGRELGIHGGFGNGGAAPAPPGAGGGGAPPGRGGRARPGPPG